MKCQNDNKKNAKDAESYIVPLLQEKYFFKVKYPMAKKDLIELSNFAKYEVFNEGETVFKQGDFADKFYLILKGQCCV